MIQTLKLTWAVAAAAVVAACYEECEACDVPGGLSERFSRPLTPLGCVSPAGDRSCKGGGQELGRASIPCSQFKPGEATYNWPLGSTSKQGVQTESGVCWEQCWQFAQKGSMLC